MERMNLSRWAVRHPNLVGFLIAILFATGAVQFMALGRDEDPSFTLKEMIVAVTWPGASPQQMQSQAADPVERTLRSIGHLDFLETYCVEGGCVTRVNLKDSAPKGDVATIWQQVRKRLKDLEPTLPAGVHVSADEDNAYVYGYVYTLTGAPNARLVELAERTRDVMLRVPGVAKAQIIGEIPRRIFVDFDPRRLAGMGIAPSQLARVLSQRAMVTPAGVSEQAVRVPIRVGGALDSIDAVENTRLSTPGGAIRVADAATVSRGYADPPDALVRHGGQPAVTLAIAMAPGADGLGLGKQLDDAAGVIRRSLPHGVALTQIENQSKNISEAVNTFLVKFFCALAVVLVVAFLSLGWRTGVVVALSVPLTLAIVALFMGAAGINLERISLGALILSLGLLVDDAIISVEAMVVQLEKGANREDAAAFAWTHTAFPMLTGTLLTVVGFLPVGFAQSTTSEYAGGIFWVTGSALIVSWFVAVIFTPYLGVRLLPEMKSQHGADMYNTPMYRRLRAAVSWCVDRRRTVVIATAILLGLSVGGTMLVRQQFFPPSDRPEIVVDLALKPGSSIAATSAAVARVEALVRKDADIRHFDSYIGQGAPRFYLPYAPMLPNPATATMLLVASDLAARERVIERLTHTQVAPQAKIHVRRLSLGPNAGFPIQYRIVGRDPGTLRSIADRIVTILRATPGAVAVQVNWGAQTPVSRIEIDAGRVARLGLDRAALASDVNTVVSGQPAGEVLEDTKRIGVVVRGQSSDRGDLSRLADLTVSTPGGPVPLAAIGRQRAGTEDPIVWARNGETAMTVEADMATDVQAADVTQAAAERIAAVNAALPAGYRIEAGGDEELSAKANTAIYKMLPITLAAMLLLLMFQLQSIGQTMLVLATAPLGLIGAVVALLLTGAPFGFVALLGLIALAGMIMRNSIILVDQVQHSHGEGEDRHPKLRDAIVEATVARSRPVVLTALAAIFAFIPLCFNIFWGPMAIVMIGGLIGATVLTLVALPALYALVFDRSNRVDQAYAAKERAHD